MDKPHYMTLAGIATKYHPSTGKISAKRLDHKPGYPIAYLSTGNYSNPVEAHAECAKLLIAKMAVDWTINPAGAFDHDRYIWTMELRGKPQIKSITVIGKEWFDKANGNSYCSADVIVDGKLYQTAYSLGYGDYYMQAACEILKKAGVICSTEYTPLWQYCSDNGIALNKYLFDCKKSELNDTECFPL